MDFVTARLVGLSPAPRSFAVALRPIPSVIQLSPSLTTSPADRQYPLGIMATDRRNWGNAFAGQAAEYYQL